MAIIKRNLRNRPDIIERQFRRHYNDGLGGLRFEAFQVGWTEAWLECKHQIEAENKRLKEDLIEFGQHQPGCCAQFNKKYSCRCGWTKVKQALKGKP